MSASLKDWQADKRVEAAAAARERAAAEVAAVEESHRAALAEVRSLQEAVDAQIAALEHGRGGTSLRELNTSKAVLLSARKRAEELAASSEAVYAAYSAAEREMEEATAAARAEAWPVWLEAYRAAVRRLDAGLAEAVAAGEEVAALHPKMAALFGSSGSWLLAPDGSRIGSAVYDGARRLTPSSFAVWRAWVAENVLGDDTSKARALATQAAARLRQMVS